MLALLVAIQLVSSPIPPVQAVNGAPPDDTGNVTVAVPAAAVTPPLGAEVIGGTVGSPGVYMPSGSSPPRITRAASCTLSAGGTCSVTWSTALAANPMIIITPVNTGATQPISCNTTASPTTTGAAIKCWTEQTTTLSLAIVTSGLTLAPAVTAPAGTVIQIVAIPPTQ